MIDRIKDIAETCHYLTKLPFGFVFLITGSIISFDSTNALKLLFVVPLFILAFFGNLGPNFKTLNIPGEIALFILMVHGAIYLINNSSQYSAVGWFVFIVITICYFPVGIVSLLYTILHTE